METVILWVVVGAVVTGIAVKVIEWFFNSDSFFN